MHFARCAARLAALAACLGTAPSALASLELLHVEANEGGSSGGHAALRFDAATFHFQSVGGLLLLAREDSRSFVHDYALLGNRPIHALRIEVAAEEERVARERFQARLAAQQSQLDALEALRAEQALLALLLRRARGEGDLEEGLAVPGAGYFEDPGPAPGPAHPAPVDPALAALRDAVVRAHGEEFFARRQRALRREMAELEPDLASGLPARLDAYALVPLRPGFGARYAELAAARVALDVLAEARPLRSDALLGAADPALPLAPDAERALRAFADRLRTSLLRRLAGPGAELGRPLLVGMARLAAIEASLRDGRLRVLDAYAEPTPDRIDLARRRDLLPAIARESRAAAREALRRFVTSGGSQSAFADLEDAANRHLELLAASREGRPMRAQAERLVPARSARRGELVPVHASRGRLERALAAATQREQRLAGEVERLHGYQLVAHNCVSELVATLESAFGGGERAAAALGGRIGGGLDVIPFVAATSAARRYRVAEGPHTVPSLRGARLARMRAAEGAFRVVLRESSPFTARARPRGARDSFFLFYTDHVFWPRPLFGAFNLVAGAGEAAFGLVRAPFDGGRTLLRGLHGALMSLPELAFVNLRKGTHDWVPESAWQEVGLPTEASGRAS